MLLLTYKNKIYKMNFQLLLQWVKKWYLFYLVKLIELIIYEFEFSYSYYINFIFFQVNAKYNPESIKIAAIAYNIYPYSCVISGSL